MWQVLGYFRHKDDHELTPLTVLVAIEADGELYVYCPKEQHCRTDRGYLEECVPIAKEQYIQASKGFYTPREYLREE